MVSVATPPSEVAPPSNDNDPDRRPSWFKAHRTQVIAGLAGTALLVAAAIGIPAALKAANQSGEGAAPDPNEGGVPAATGLPFETDKPAPIETGIALGPDLRFDQDAQTLGVNIIEGVLTNMANAGADQTLDDRAYDDNMTFDQLAPIIAQEQADEYGQEYFENADDPNSPAAADIARIQESDERTISLYGYTAFRTEGDIPVAYSTKFTVKGEVTEVSNDGTTRVLTLVANQSDTAAQSEGLVPEVVTGIDLNYTITLRNGTGADAGEAKIVSIALT